MKFEPYSNSLTGTWTHVNGDRYHADPDSGLFIVTDGGDDSFAGEASLDILRDYMMEHIRTKLPEDEDLHNIIRRTNERILEMHEASCFETVPVISTTVVVLRETEYRIAHVGSSRAYLARGGLLLQLTRDHTRAFESFRRGDMTKDEAAVSTESSRLTRWIGNATGVEPDVRKGSLVVGDRLLICTDGLTRILSDDELLHAIESSPDPSSVCRTIFEHAFEREERDTVTLITISLASHLDDHPQTAVQGHGIPLPPPSEPSPPQPTDEVGNALDEAVDALSDFISESTSQDTEKEERDTGPVIDVVEPELPPVETESPLPPVETESPPPPAKRRTRPSKRVKREEIWGPPVPRRVIEDASPPETFFETNLFLLLFLVGAILFIFVLSRSP